MFYEAMMMT